MADTNLDDFLGMKQQPAWRRWGKWALVLAATACHYGTVWASMSGVAALS